MERSNHLENSPESINIPVELYQISGHGEIDLNKYLRNKRWDNQIELVAKQEDALNEILNLPESERAKLISDALFHGNLEIQKKAVEKIEHAPEKERASLIKIALNHQNIEVQELAVKMIEYVQKEERTALIKQALSLEHPDIRLTAAMMINYAPEEE